jgi:hypothetical protein
MHTARKTLSVLRSDPALNSSDFVSTDFTGFSAALFYFCQLSRRRRLDERLMAKGHAGLSFSATWPPARAGTEL